MSARHSTPPPPFDDESWLPFSNLSQKGRVHFVHVDWGSLSFCFGVRLYLGASLMYFFFFGSWCIYFLWFVYVRGRHYVLCLCLLFLVSHVIHWLLIYIMRLFTVYVFYFLFCEIKNILLVYLYFPHMCLCVCWVFQEYIGLFNRDTVYNGNW